jgi:hypothetical protein
MTLKPVLSFLALTILLSCWSVKVPIQGKIKTISLNKWKDTLTYHYDDQGRISSITTDRGYLTSYEYKGNTIVERTKGGSTVTMFLNSKGLVDSLIDIDSNRTTISIPNGDGTNNEQYNFGIHRYFPYSGNHVLPLDEIAGVTTHSILAFSKKFTYDELGFIKEERVHITGNRQIISKAVISKGNITSYSVKYPVDTIQMLNPKTSKMEAMIMRQVDFTVKNSFDEAKTNSLSTNPFLGKSSKNLVLRSVQYGAGDSNVTTFKYTFDDRSRVSTLITKVKTNDPPEIKEFTERPDTCHITYY